MLNNYIGGGQVFLHKIRMFLQVFWRSVSVSMLVSSALALLVFLPQLSGQDLEAAFSYRKAAMAAGFDAAINPLRASISTNNKEHVTLVDAKTRGGVYGQNMHPRKVMSMEVFRKADAGVLNILANMLIFAGFALLAAFLLIFVLWNRFGKFIKSDHKIKGGQILTADQVRSILKALRLASSFHIGNMPLVKDSQTRHFLICGATGSGKTNLIDCMLAQVEQKKQPAIVIDQTGEMISRYYNPKRGDIIFNPLDARGQNWDFWADCFEENQAEGGKSQSLEKFAKILFGFNRKNGVSHSDPFWDNSAEAVFIECANYARGGGINRTEMLKNMLANWSLKELSEELACTPAARYLTNSNHVTANSILSVMTTATRPLRYLSEADPQSGFSLKAHLKAVKEGSNAWLFLSTKPSQRELTMPLVACLVDLAVSLLMENGINKDQRLWFVLDELASLGRLPALNALMSEGRKYGACVLAAMQSLNQLYLNYGGYAGSSIFGQFGTKFFFRNDEPQIAKMITDLCGTELINRQQKNTSFGANELRDGVSYTEQEKYKPLVEYSDLASLEVGKCYVLLPEPKARLGKIEVPGVNTPKKNEEFIPRSLADIGDNPARVKPEQESSQPEESGISDNEGSPLVLAEPEMEMER